MNHRKTFRSDRADGRFATTSGFVHHLMKTTEPKLAFDPDADQGKWRRDVRRKLKELLAFPTPPKQPAPGMIDSEPRDGYALQSWELYPEPGCVVPFLMLVPDGATKASPAPAVVCMPGSAYPKENLAGEPTPGWSNPWGERQHMAKHYAQAGCVALAFDNPGTCALVDPAEDDWTRQSWPLVWLGRSYEGLSTFQKIVALKWLKGLPFVDRKRLATSGHSLGSKPALLAAILDPDVRAVVWNNPVGDKRERCVATNLNCPPPWHYIPGFLQWFTYVDLMAALAPRALLCCEGGRGPDFTRIRKAYRIAGAPGAVRVSYMPNFQKASARPFDRRKAPEGLTAEEYQAYMNVDGDHYFKDDVAVPWLMRALAR